MNVFNCARDNSEQSQRDRQFDLVLVFARTIFDMICIISLRIKEGERERASILELSNFYTRVTDA